MSGSLSSLIRSCASRAAPIVGMAALAAMLTGTIPTAAVAATPPRVTTPYPAVVVAPGAKVSYELTVTSGQAGAVDLAVGGLPEGWSASLRGGGFEIGSVYVGPGSAGQATLDVTVPDSAAAGRHSLTLTASSSGGRSTLQLEIRVNATAGGQVTLASDFPTLRGASGTTFRFTLTLSNDTPQDQTFAVSAEGPAGWQVDARPSTQEQAASVAVKARSTATISVTANPPSSAPAGDYPISVKATAGNSEVDAQLSVQVIGEYKLSLTTPDQRLNAQGTAGSPIDFQLVLDNTGSAALTAVKLSATPPTGWKVTFQPATVDSIEAGGSATVTATMTPSDQAIAGDYDVSFHAAAAEASADQDIRVTVETSMTWAIVGAGLIIAAFVGLGWVFRRYGRR